LCMFLPPIAAAVYPKRIKSYFLLAVLFGNTQIRCTAVLQFYFSSSCRRPKDNST